MTCIIGIGLMKARPGIYAQPAPESFEPFENTDGNPLDNTDGEPLEHTSEETP